VILRVNRLRFKGGLILTGFVSAFPLLALVSWAYLHAIPYAYLSVEELLLQTYYAAAVPLPMTFFYSRAALICIYICALILFLLHRSNKRAEAVLAGVMSSFILTMPVFVPTLLGASEAAVAILWLVVLGGCAIGVQGLVVRASAVTAPLVVAFLLVGSYLSVISSAEIVLRSKPPLFVLANAARNQSKPDAQLALGMHLLSIGGGKEVEPILREAGRALELRFRQSGEEELLRVAVQVAAWSYEETSPTGIQQASESNE